MEFPRRDGGSKPDAALYTDCYRLTSTATNLVKVVFGDCRPEALTQPDLEDELATLQIDHEVLKAPREADAS